MYFTSAYMWKKQGCPKNAKMLAWDWCLSGGTDLQPGTELHCVPLRGKHRATTPFILLFLFINLIIWIPQSFCNDSWPVQPDLFLKIPWLPKSLATQYT